MSPFGFALAGAVLLTTSLAAFDTFGQGGPTTPVEIARVEQSPASAVPAPVSAAPVDGPRRPVRVILSSPYDRQG